MTTVTTLQKSGYKGVKVTSMIKVLKSYVMSLIFHIIV